MSGLDALSLDADGYLDMDQFPDDGTDLAGQDLADLRDALLSDPVDEPTPDEWDALLDDVVTDDGPFALDDPDGTTFAYEGIEGGADDLADPAPDGAEADADSDDAGDDAGGEGDGFDPLDAADLGDDGLDLADGGLDLLDEAGAGDDGSVPDVPDEPLPNVGPEFEDYL